MGSFKILEAGDTIVAGDGVAKHAEVDGDGGDDGDGKVILY